MGINKLADIIKHGTEELGISMSKKTITAFERYFDYLEKRGKFDNLTAISGEGDVARLHFIDSLAILKNYEFRNMKVIDIGSGAGFPGVPLKLAEPTIKLTLLDAAVKRVDFLTGLCATLAIKADCIHARAEEAAHEQHMRERYDIVVARAVARLSVLCELCLPFIAVGGAFIAMKGTGSSDEANEAYGAIKALGSEIEEIADYVIPDTDIVHRAIIIRKRAKTPEIYPRRFSKIKKNPL